jgi:hypothetical protein
VSDLGLRDTGDEVIRVIHTHITTVNEIVMGLFLEQQDQQIEAKEGSED